MKIEFVDADAKPAETTALAVLAFEDGEYSPAAEALDAQLSGALKRAVAASRFKGSAGQIVQHSGARRRRGGAGAGGRRRQAERLRCEGRGKRRRLRLQRRQG